MTGFTPIGSAPIGDSGDETSASVILTGANCVEQSTSLAGIIGVIPVIFLEGSGSLEIGLSSSNVIIVDGIIKMDYTEIVNLAKDYSDRRKDPEIIASTDSFLRIVEAKINRKLATQKAVISKNIKLYEGQEYHDLPTDYLSAYDVYFKSLTDNKRRATLEYKTPAQLNDAICTGDNKELYTIIGTKIKVNPVPTALFAENFALCLDFYLRIAPLTRENPSNYISVFNVDCYLFGMMAEINAFVKDAEAFTLWDARFENVINEIDLQDTAFKTGDGPQIMRLG